MAARFRVWGWGATTAAALLGVEALVASAVRAQGRQVLGPGPASLDEMVGLVAASLALVLGAWLAVSSTAAVLAHAPGRLGAAGARVADAWAPLLTRRVAAALVGAAIGSTLGPATALAGETTPFPGFSATAGVVAVGTASATPSWQAPSSSSDPATPAAGWTPTRPESRAVAAPDLVTAGATQRTTPTDGHDLGRSGSEVVVHRGDTLWDLVAAHLGPDATDAEVAAAWPRWHVANRTVIGDDPDHLLPGQVLVVPTAAVSR